VGALLWGWGGGEPSWGSRLQRLLQIECLKRQTPPHPTQLATLPTPNPPNPPTAGHAGYELSPFIPTIEGIIALLLNGPKGWSGINTVQHHDMHHRFPTRHFSLYFTHWDRLCGTMYPGYDAQLFRYFSK